MISTLADEVAERVVEQLADVGAALAGQRADVDLDVDRVGDHVGLGAAVDDRGRERRVRARVRLAGEADRQRLAELGERVLVEEVRVPLGTEVDALDEAAPRVVDLRGRPVLGEPAHDLGRGHERVVGAERLRRVTRACRAP